jgi:hypothetical protein
LLVLEVLFQQKFDKAMLDGIGVSCEVNEYNKKHLLSNFQFDVLLMTIYGISAFLQVYVIIMNLSLF